LDVGLTEVEQDPYETLRNFRTTERAQMIGAIRDLIEEAQKRVKSKNTPSRDRTKWMKLAGQLIWYKDQVLRSLTYEALEKDVAELKKKVIEKYPDRSKPSSPDPPVYCRRTIRGPGKAIRVTRSQRPVATTPRKKSAPEADSTQRRILQTSTSR
jgi:hypothetical protein